ncbi:MAG: hypothetical protein AB1633_11660 [Elusimicrobiota bacterium]
MSTYPWYYFRGALPTEDQTIICLTISYDPQGQQVLDQSIIVVPYSQNERGVKVQGKFNGVKIEKGKEYYVTASILTQGEIKFTAILL